MTTLIQAAQQALDALLALHADGARAGWHLHPKWEAQMRAASDSINALRTALQPAQASEPVYWEWRHQGSHPDAVDFGQWSEWKRVEPRSLLHTVDDALREFNGYIAQGYKYELRPLYTHPAPGVPDDAVRDADAGA